MEKNIKAVIFDLDGTLVDSLADINNSINQVLKEHGFPPQSLTELRKAVGAGAGALIRRSCPVGTPDDVAERILQRYIIIYRNNCCKETRLYNGVEQLLRELASRGVLTGLISNKTDATARVITQYYLPDFCFDVFRGNTGDIKLKPEPDMGLWACRELGIQPGDAIYLGDSDSDMIFSKAVGFSPAGAAWGFRGPEELIANGADAVIDSPLELLRFIV